MLLDFSFLDLKHTIKYIELAAAIVGSIYFYKYKHTPLKYFLMLLWLVVFVEFFGKFYFKVFYSNYIVFNIYHFINFTTLLLLYRAVIENKDYKKWVGLFIPIYIVSFFVNLLFQDYFTQIQTFPFIIGGLLVIISIIFYFLEILNTNKVLYVSKNLLFWISIGLLIYFVGKIPTRLMRNYWTEISYYESIFIVEYILSIFMNICFIIGFICTGKQRQY